MKVHHLNCGTMTPPAMAPIVAHVLLLETDDGLVLVDTGFGLQHCADPKRRLGPGRHLVRPVRSGRPRARRGCATAARSSSTTPAPGGARPGR